MSIWFKHDAHFHEHPKCLRLRRLAGGKADSAEVGWWRIVAAAKRLGTWTFEDEEHLRNAAGRYFGFVSLYRQVGLLDDLEIHNGSEYQAPLTGAERVAKHRTVTPVVTPDVTDVTPRESREEKSREERADARDALDVYHELTGYRPWGTWSGDALKGAINDYTDSAVQEALLGEWRANPKRDDLLKRAQARLARDADRARSVVRAVPKPKRKSTDAERIAALREFKEAG